jgi:hypothetical protein
MTIGEGIARVKALYNKGVASDDAALSDRHIYAKLVSVRTLLAKREIDKKRQVSDWIVQTIGCLELIPVDDRECPCPVPPGCKVLRSKEKLPKPIQSFIGPELEFVTSLDGDVVYSKTNVVKRRYKSGNKYTADVPDYMIKNEYLYLVKAGNLLKFVTVGGVFEDPLAVRLVEGCSKEDCLDPYTVEFKIDQHLVDAMVQMASQELIQIFKVMPGDEENNATEDKQRGQPQRPQ